MGIIIKFPNISFKQMCLTSNYNFHFFQYREGIVVMAGNHSH